MTQTLPREFLDGVGIDIVRELSLALGPHFKSGDLLNSIQYRITDAGLIEISMLPYWEYVEYGTPGQLQGQSSTVGDATVSFGANPSRKMPVKKAGDSFVNFIDGTDNFALAKHIQLYGTRPYPFVRTVLYHKLSKIVQENAKRHLGGPKKTSNEKVSVK